MSIEEQSGGDPNPADVPDPLLDRPAEISVDALITMMTAQLGTAVSPKVVEALRANLTGKMLEDARKQEALRGESNQPLTIVQIVLEMLGLDATLGRVDIGAIEGLLDAANAKVKAGDARSVFEAVKQSVGGSADIRRILGRQPIRREAERVGRNDACPCGSGKKYKNCCMKKAAK